MKENGVTPKHPFLLAGTIGQKHPSYEQLVKNAGINTLGGKGNR